MPAHTRTAVLLTMTALTLILTACDDNKAGGDAPSTTEPAAVTPAKTKSKSDPKAAPEGPAPTVAELKAVHPDKLGDWSFKSAKTKNQTWGVEYSGTYTKGGDELKVVINRANEDDPAGWVELFKTAKDVDGRPSVLDKRDTKETFMVRVGKRWRVDFKTKKPGSVDLESLAKNYDFTSVEKLSAK